MKFLDYPELESLSRALTFESPECKVFTRLEAYSCKAVKSERQLFKTLETQYLQSASLSPPKYMDEALASPFGRLDQVQARKTLFLLIATLNGAFPDHDFSGVHPSDFRRESSSDSVLNSLGTTLLQLRTNSNAPRSFSSFPSSYDEEERTSTRTGRFSTSGKVNHPQLNAVLDDIMSISECEVYTFHPDVDSDPHASAEPEEEGDDMDDERYADDESVSEEDDEGQNDMGAGSVMRGEHDEYDTRMSTPPQRASSSFDEDMDDAPMFDEDLLGFGFTPVQSRVSSTVTTPRTPASSARARAGDFFSSKKVASARRTRVPATATASAPSRMGHSTLSSRMSLGAAERQATYSSANATAFALDEEQDVDEYDDNQGLHGLLWATYAFFYNRKQKRILFVSVWSRRSNSGAPSYTFSPPSYPSLARQTDDVPPLSIEQAVSSGSGNILSKSAEVTIGQTDGNKAPSAARRAIARSTGASAIPTDRPTPRSKRARDLSASPAPPSLRSPFPHDSPKRQDALQNAAQQQRPSSATDIATASPLRIGSHPGTSRTLSSNLAFDQPVEGSPPVVMSSSSNSSSSASVKRGLASMTEANARQAPSHAIADESAARKQRKVHAMSE